MYRDYMRLPDEDKIPKPHASFITFYTKKNEYSKKNNQKTF